MRYDRHGGILKEENFFDINNEILLLLVFVILSSGFCHDFTLESGIFNIYTI